MSNKIKTADIQIRDPFIFMKDGKYYLFGSTDKDIWNSPGVGFDVYAGDDLENWGEPIHAFTPPENFWAERNFWAPEVYEYNGAYYMFASFYAEGHMRGTAILRAENPEGPYAEWSDGAVTPSEWMCLDGTFYLEEHPWIVYCHEWVQCQDGTVCAQRLSEDLQKTVGEPVVLFHASDAAWSRPATSKSWQMTGFVTDGCNLFKMRNGKLLMLWSTIGEEGYCIGYAVSESGSILGPWKQLPEPLFKKDGGHGMIFKSYDGRLLLTIHTPNDSPNERPAFFELTETENGLELK